jgi:hypothetical protein
MMAQQAPIILARNLVLPAKLAALAARAVLVVPLLKKLAARLQARPLPDLRAALAERAERISAAAAVVVQPVRAEQAALAELPLL